MWRRFEFHRNVANSGSVRSANGLRRYTSSVLYAPSADSTMALSYESPTVPSSRISEIERGARNLPELKQRVQTLDNV